MLLDQVLTEVGECLRVLAGAAPAERPNPALSTEASTLSLSTEEKRHAAALMRINHVGEVCAQALYRGQALTSKASPVRSWLYQAAREEVDHLAWTGERIQQLGSRTSLLNPLWYAASFGLGCLAGLAPKAYALGFIAETEKQVEQHLDGHLGTLPEHDKESRAIVQQMQQDEMKHREQAIQEGAKELPLPIKGLMRVGAKTMTSTSYYL
jgi:3-demethoxyubiquinol 3-hydroxylase